MKRFVMIVLMALIASRVLSARDHRRDSRPAERPSIIKALFQDDPAPAPPEPPQPPRARRSSRERANRVTPALALTTNPQVAPAWFPKSAWEEEAAAHPDPVGVRVLVGRLSVSEDRARLDLHKMVNHEIADWLAADIPMTWTPPNRLVDEMVQGNHVQTVTRTIGPRSGSAATETLANLDDLHTFFRAGQKLDFSEGKKSRFIERYHRDVASDRMRKTGAILAVVLASLALFSAYVRTDEATKGYYTNRLRTVGMVGLGTAGAVAYHYWS